ncbi:hypothetical protein, partial [Streptomyces xinghaiensis]|uniref:hypothetical protein n=1 Tax=Streptomyces xinghaiensis TaxID=1038928 RepID=UPI001A7EC372
MVDQAQRWSAVPQRRQVRHAVAHFDQQVAVADLAGEGRPGPQEVACVTSRGDHPVVAFGGRAAAHERDLVATGGQTVGYPVDEQFRA